MGRTTSKPTYPGIESEKKCTVNIFEWLVLNGPRCRDRKKKELSKRNLPALAVRSVGLEENVSTAGKKRQGLAGGIGVSFMVTCPRKKTCRHRRSQLSVIFGGELSRPVSCLVHPHKCNPCPCRQLQSFLHNSFSTTPRYRIRCQWPL